MGKLLAICTSPQRGTVKTEVESARLTPEWGIETDAHGGISSTTSPMAKRLVTGRLRKS